jgi:hypothetical protein
MVYNLVIKVASDSVDSFILLVAQIALIMATFSAGVSIVFLIDFFKRHGWTYKHKKKKFTKDEQASKSKLMSRSDK